MTLRVAGTKILLNHFCITSVINIKKFNKNGSLDVTYYNPKPVNVSRSMFMQKNSELKVFIELIDKGYPRSTYTLNYDQKNHALLGDYFHAGMNKTFKTSNFI